jgi:hypothetical protein
MLAVIPAEAGIHVVNGQKPPLAAFDFLVTPAKAGVQTLNGSRAPRATQKT